MTTEFHSIMDTPEGKAQAFTSLQKKTGNEPEQTSSGYAAPDFTVLPPSSETMNEASPHLVHAPGNDFFLHVIETAAQPFCSAYSDGRIKAHNPAFLDLMGYTAEELRQKTGPI